MLKQMEHSDAETEENAVIEKTAPDSATYRILSFRSCAPEAYAGLVYSGWMHSLRYGNDMFKLMDQRPFYDAYKHYIESILKRPNSRLRVAVLTEDEDVALGWCVDEGNTLHYVYVPRDYRKAGIGRSLVPKDIRNFTHITTIGLSIWNEKFPTARFNPFL